jgi:hypothetical protein
MKNLSFSFLLFLCIGITLVSCKKEEASEPSVITASDFSVTLPNTTQNNTVAGTVTATTNSGTLTYSIASQGIGGALAINATTGQITVANALEIYKFRCVSINPPTSFTATITISNGTITKNITLTVVLTSLGCA